MKKYYVLLLAPLFLLGAHTAFAIPLNGACTGTVDQNECDGSYVCIGGKCVTDPQLDPPTSGTQTPAAGGTTAAPATGGTGAAPSAAPGTTNTSFIPLTNLPGINTVASSDSLSSFFNNLYKICIGLAAILAMLQIIRAGFMRMTAADNAGQVGESNKLIASAIFGLVLVLSPVIVFSIINKNILSLQLNVSGLTPAGGTSAGATAAPGAITPTTPLWTDNSSSRTTAQTNCATSGGTPVFTCLPNSGGTGRNVPITEACQSTEHGVTVCEPGSATPPAANGCSLYSNITALNPGQLCNSTNHYTAIPYTCCAGNVTGAVCCGIKK